MTDVVSRLGCVFACMAAVAGAWLLDLPVVRPSRAGVPACRDAGAVEERSTQPAVKVPGRRGALRALASGRYDELVLVPEAESGAWPLRLRPDYRGEELLEFYGIGIGRCRAYLDGPEGPSKPVVVEIREGALAVVSLEPATACRRRDLILLRGGRPLPGRATVLASYRDGFGALLPWEGEVCALPAPFGVPDRVAVRVHTEGPQALMGAAGLPRAAAGRLLFDLEVGQRRIVCKRVERADDASRAFRVAWSGPVAGLRLSCLRASEAMYPCSPGTWCSRAGTVRTSTSTRTGT